MLEMTLARFLRSLTRFRRLQPKIGRVHSVLLRHSRGRLRRSHLLAGGQPVLALTTSGRRSGAKRTTTIAYLRHGDGYAVAAMNLGSDRDPGWCLNLRADPRAIVHLNGGQHAVRARVARGVEAEALWRAYFNRLPGAEHFRELARREVPMFVLDPVV